MLLLLGKITYIQASHPSSLLAVLSFSGFILSVSPLYCANVERPSKSRLGFFFSFARRSSELVVIGAMLPLRNPRNKVLFDFVVYPNAA
ncbi:uncharacterized protein LY79DRAFT_76447 [Colletotrichum navitas]|uniref:Uncharacterized protein n=1 Tax=Colletotrichum navitas TaxID=681940 RepID=A0AAD8Q6B4_9PEZI|nr:uncharacterized protein LY79DRAFT_76447 [Colletotrichum navitas]KAK1596053.1 hypothetical protein LY79DRAFT_76447 [Colletotrichum navitas]